MPPRALKIDLKDIREYSPVNCPLHGLLNVLGGTWTSYILWFIHTNGPMRFGQIKKQLPAISAKVLTERLRMLEEAGILNRAQEATIPPKVTYSFTARGHELSVVLTQLGTLANKWVVEKPKRTK